MLSPIGVPVGEALGAVTAEGFGPNGIPSRRLRRPGDGADPARTNFADTDDRATVTGKRGGHRGRHHRRGRRQRLAGAAAVQPRSRPARR